MMLIPHVAVDYEVGGTEIFLWRRAVDKRLLLYKIGVGVSTR